ncbi:MAG: polyprenyl synthetase family protein [SAR324 cluster bacterium]|nr:polyprenyl synthetase family protein [SAR324 cluster bacterium]MBL7035341.1 polyprenyl synthetase family protein [SAR324 cluster bacterium]
MKVKSRDHSTLKSYLKSAGQWIGEETIRCIPDSEPKEYLYDLMQNYPLRGGKRFRPALVLLSCELFGGDPEDALTSAVALELFHNFALIHDDIEDESLLRRGTPTLHLQYGIALALNSGDALLGLVHEILLENHLRLEGTLALKIHRQLNKVMQATFEGQALDIGWVVNKVFPDRAEYREMISRKTGWYSGKGPCQCGALIAGASKTELEIIGSFGEAIGIGFQVRDDLLNLTEESETVAPNAGAGGYGKERGGDIAEGKRTLITIELLERLPAAEAEELRSILLAERDQVTESEINWCIEKAKNSGALDSVADYCQQHAIQAADALTKLPHNSAGSLLGELVDYLTIERKA